MDREDVAYLINSTPKYYFLLELHVALIRRYAPRLRWPIYFATEEPKHPLAVKLASQQDVIIIPLHPKDAGFFDSRRAAVEALPAAIRQVVPMQEDFLLDRTPDWEAIDQSFRILDSENEVQTLRWMPCPGPSPQDGEYRGSWNWKVLSRERDAYRFTYQATVWRRETCENFWVALCREVREKYPNLSPKERVHLEVRVNYAEISKGQELFDRVCAGTHLAWGRRGPWSNAVYLSPWPYRPTAIVKGRLEDFAKELGQREGFPLQENP